MKKKKFTLEELKRMNEVTRQQIERCRATIKTAEHFLNQQKARKAILEKVQQEQTMEKIALQCQLPVELHPTFSLLHHN